MQIDTNTTGMPAGLAVATDRDGRQHCIAVVKGTFAIAADGTPRLAAAQEPMIYADVHHGDPETTSIRYGCDFSPTKPFVDVLVGGHAYAPNRGSATQVKVTLTLGTLHKEAMVYGDRVWRKGLLGTISATSPEPFSAMPLLWERAFGGSDESHADVERRATELRNLVGRGFRTNHDAHAISGTLLPNIEHPHYALRAWSERPPPIGFGIVGRSWRPRIGYAGTYGQKWRDERFPFLPSDFDPRYHQLAPEDQWLTDLAGGEIVRCTNMTPSGLFVAAVPQVAVPVRFLFRDRRKDLRARLDTLIVEPDEQRLIITWRAAIPLGAKFHTLRAVLVGKPPAHRITVATPPSQVERGVKPHFGSLRDYIAWRSRWGLG